MVRAGPGSLQEREQRKSRGSFQAFPRTEFGLCSRARVPRDDTSPDWGGCGGITLYEKALQVDPKLTVVHYLIADALLKQTDADPARVESHLKRAVESDSIFAPRDSRSGNSSCVQDVGPRPLPSLNK